MKYSIDTSVFIEAWNRHYPPDVFPANWDKFAHAISTAKFRAIIEVYRVIEQHGDELFEWTKQRKSKFVSLSVPIQRRVRTIMGGVPTLVKIDATRRDADPFVIALAQDEGLTVVTYELSRPTKPKIPDVCRSLKVPCITVVELFRAEEWTF